MKLASVTLSNSRAEIISDALRSVVPWVGLVLLIDTGIKDQTREVAQEIAGMKLHVIPFTRTDLPFSEWRNLGLDAATALKANRAVSLDTDERVELKQFDIRGYLKRQPADIVLAPMNTGYFKERFFKLPLKDRFTGRYHEGVRPREGTFDVLENIVVNEIPKTREELDAKHEWLLGQIQIDLQTDPEDARAWYYLGDALDALHRNGEALQAFLQSARLAESDEESAWSHFRAAALHADGGRYEQAYKVCLAGIGRHSGVPELAWLAGEMLLITGKPELAIYWGRMAATNGAVRGKPYRVNPRLGPRLKWGLCQGPYDLQARAYEALGRNREAKACRERIKGTKICNPESV